MAGAGLGLRLHDRRHGTNLHEQAFEPWWSYAREHYLDLADGGSPETTTFYYDPVLDVHHRLPVRANLTTCFYAAPQAAADARRLFGAATADLGLDRDLPLPLPPNRAPAAALILAREWGLTELEARLVGAIEASYEPTWDDDRGEFTWGMGLDEPHPRGQFNAFLAAAEACGPGRWTALSAAPLPPGPRVVGVDFPAMALQRADWRDGALLLGLAPLAADARARSGFRVEGLEPREWEPAWLDDGATELRDRTTVERSGDVLKVEVPMVAAELELRPGA